MHLHRNLLCRDYFESSRHRVWQKGESLVLDMQHLLAGQLLQQDVDDISKGGRHCDL